MSYTICISPSCANCQEIMLKLKEMNVEFEAKNIELEKNCEVSIIPALFMGTQLIAYGKDILRYFKRKELFKEHICYN